MKISLSNIVIMSFRLPFLLYSYPVVLPPVPTYILKWKYALFAFKGGSRYRKKSLLLWVSKALLFSYTSLPYLFPHTSSS